MIDQSLPFPGLGDREWRLWLELWGRAARQPELRAVAARLYERYDAWIAEAIDEGIAGGEFSAGDARAVTQRLIAAIDGHGLRVLVDDPAMAPARARALIVGALAAELGTDERGIRSDWGDVMESAMRRREFLQGGAGLALGASLLGTGCGVGQEKASEQAVKKVVPAKIDGDLLIFNWTEYMDPRADQGLREAVRRQGRARPTSTRCRA